MELLSPIAYPSRSTQPSVVGEFPEWAFAVKWTTSESAVIHAQSPMYQQWPHLGFADSPTVHASPDGSGLAETDRLPRIDAFARHLSHFVGKWRCPQFSR